MRKRGERNPKDDILHKDDIGGTTVIFRQNYAAPFQMLYSILVGVGGTLVLVIFLMTFVHALGVIRYVPWILGFNSALAAYTLLNRGGSRVKHMQRSAVCVGVAHIFASYLILTLLFSYWIGDFVFSGGDVLLFLFIGALCSEAGALLAIKYLGLKNEESRP